ncbi:hypothetical protein M271_19220 [Streptomyces rapamycinicus NRRL 5491]|nr:hypothetical protein [Streptomyces rapamycinicus]AGP55393.1 hypothetical protein M271_19220 [Streptomyces rapamycinicus NRRL 5491]MBB4782952.1 hypothetical protein [Streptomyces rapamycinicus]
MRYFLACYFSVPGEVFGDSSGDEGGAGGVAGTDVAPSCFRDRVFLGCLGNGALMLGPFGA